MRNALLLCLSGFLVACGAAGRERGAADACLVEVNKRLTGKRFDVDVDRLAASAMSIAPETLQLSAAIVFDRGLAREYTQTIECRVRLAADAPTVIFLQFNWNMDDVKKGQ